MVGLEVRKVKNEEDESSDKNGDSTCDERDAASAHRVTWSIDLSVSAHNPKTILDTAIQECDLIDRETTNHKTLLMLDSGLLASRLAEEAIDRSVDLWVDSTLDIGRRVERPRLLCEKARATRTRESRVWDGTAQLGVKSFLHHTLRKNVSEFDFKLREDDELARALAIVAGDNATASAWHALSPPRTSAIMTAVVNVLGSAIAIAVGDPLRSFDHTSAHARDTLRGTSTSTRDALTGTSAKAEVAAFDVLRVREDQMGMIVFEVLLRWANHVPRTHRHSHVDHASLVRAFSGRELTIFDKGFEGRHERIESLVVHNLR